MSKQSSFETFLARVRKTYLTKDDFKELKKDEDYVKIYNGNKSFDSKDSRFLGAIEFDRDEGYLLENYAFPLDKNNFTFPIAGETVLIIKSSDEYFYIPYTVTQYPNYREDYKTTVVGDKKEIKKVEDNSKQKDYKEVNGTGTTSNSPSKKPEDKSKKYTVNEKIKFLEPTEGDTILSGRVGNTIRFSEFFLTEDGKTSSPSIFIRNFQDPTLDDKPIGTLVKEDINKDGSSIYITSNKVKIPFKENVKKEKVAFKEYPSSDKLIGHQIYINSDRVIIAAKKEEFILFSTKTAGIITDSKFTVDAKDDVYLHTDKNIILHSKDSNKIFLNSERGKIYLGKDKGEGAAGSEVQQMVLGGELVKILTDLIKEITLQVFATPCGPTSPGPTNVANFQAISSRLQTILSKNNLLSK
jgi:hypothetical protein